MNYGVVFDELKAPRGSGAPFVLGVVGTLVTGLTGLTMGGVGSYELFIEY